ncbi:MAG: flippase-like domain-containing protein [Proteobacteria bacterium]|nr:flippase-like domain-containing protein [Pseudomonadota bacterium]
MQSSSLSPHHKLKFTAILVAKLTVALTLLYFVLRRIDGQILLKLLVNTPLQYPLTAFLLLNLSVVTSALRSRLYFRNNGLNVTRWFFLKLYYVGMLFNIVLPGGIGGDAYKVYVLWRRHHFSRLHGIRIMFYERANGVVLLGIIGAVILPFTGFWEVLQKLIPMPLLVYGLLTALIWPVYLALGRIILKDDTSTMISASYYSAIGQILQVLMATAIVWGIEPNIEPYNLYNYLFLFAVSSVVSILPISIGGVGLREATFLLGLSWINTASKEAGIALAMMVFIMQALASLIGIIYLYEFRPSKASHAASALR